MLAQMRPLRIVALESIAVGSLLTITAQSAYAEGGTANIKAAFGMLMPKARTCSAKIGWKKL
jgi:hypothetical protein